MRQALEGAVKLSSIMKLPSRCMITLTLTIDGLRKLSCFLQYMAICAKLVPSCREHAA